MMSSESNDSVWDISLFTDAQIVQAFACQNCHNIPRQCITDMDGKIYCECCVAQLKMTDTRANSAIDKIIGQQKIKCPNVNTSFKENQENDVDDEKTSDHNNHIDDDEEDDDDYMKQKQCKWTGTIAEFIEKHNNTDCPFAIKACQHCQKYEALRYALSQHENSCDELAMECELNCGQRLRRKDMKLHLVNDCIEQTQTCTQCNRDDIKKKNLEKHLLNECFERAVVCKYASYGCDIKGVKKSELNEHYKEYGIYHLELKMNAQNNSLKEEIENMRKKVMAQNKVIEHLKYRNGKLQMQLHQKQTLKDDFLIIFESDNNKNSFISSINLRYNSSIQNNTIIKPSTHRKDNIIFGRVKDCSYCFAPNVFIDKIIGITRKAKQQHIAGCVSTMSKCPCTFNVIYCVGGDTINVNENYNICNILGTDVVFQLPQLQIPRFNHKVIYSQIHGILAVGGEPIRKEDAKREIKEIEKANENKKQRDKTPKKDKKAILGSVEQLNLAPNIALSHYYQVRNANIKKDEEKLQMPPEPELKWRNLGNSMKYRRDCPSVGLFKSGNKYEEKLFVAGGWNERDLSYVEMYDFKKREWKQLTSLNVKRNSAGICEWKQKNNNMVIIGGWNKKTTHSVEEYDAHKNQWYLLKNTNHPHKYYPACTVYHDLNPFINSGYGVIVVIGNDGRLYGEEYMKKQQNLMKQVSKESVNVAQPQLNATSSSSKDNISTTPTISDDWGFIEFYDPRDWIRKWTVIDNIPSFLNLPDADCKQLYFQSIVPCKHNPTAFDKY